MALPEVVSPEVEAIPALASPGRHGSGRAQRACATQIRSLGKAANASAKKAAEKETAAAWSPPALRARRRMRLEDPRRDRAPLPPKPAWSPQM